MAEQPIQSTFSRYKFSQAIVDASGNLLLAEREPFRFRDSPDNLNHVVKAGERWWHLAQRFYKDVSSNAGLLYWVVCDYQVPPVLDPTLTIQENSLVVAPSPIVVLTEVLGFPVEIFQ